MSMKEPSKAGADFGAIVSKPQALLTKKERAAIALKKAADQAQLELNNAIVAASAMNDKVKALEARAKDAAAKANAALKETQQ